MIIEYRASGVIIYRFKCRRTGRDRDVPVIQLTDQELINLYDQYIEQWWHRGMGRRAIKVLHAEQVRRAFNYAPGHGGLRRMVRQ